MSETPPLLCLIVFDLAVSFSIVAGLKCCRQRSQLESQHVHEWHAKRYVKLLLFCTTVRWLDKSHRDMKRRKHIVDATLVLQGKCVDGACLREPTGHPKILVTFTARAWHLAVVEATLAVPSPL